MDIGKLLSDVRNIDDYITISQDTGNKLHSGHSIQFNMSAVAAFKRVQMLEIEYFNKCHENGVAFRIFENVLRAPRSRAWSLLGKDLISVLLYWLDAVRHHLMHRHIRWWSFLKRLLSFITDIRHKDSGMSNILVQELAENLLAIATSGVPNVHQMHEILHTFNLGCTEASREVRLRMREKLDKHFVNLAHMVARCGHYPCQASAMEALLRFLQPRQERAVRAAAAERWFPPHLYHRDTVAVFLQRRWNMFFQDVRDFLNVHNAGGELVCSVVYKTLALGQLMFATSSDSRWLDINCGSRCLTIALTFGIEKGLDTLIVTPDNVASVTMLRNPASLAIKIKTVATPKVFPSCPAAVRGATEVRIVAASPADHARVDHALRTVFQDKYQRDDAKLSSVQETRRPVTPSGHVQLSKPPQSPSSVSTASLQRLPEKLAGLAPFDFKANPVRFHRIIGTPELSCVNELSEADEIANSCDSDSNSTVLPRPNFGETVLRQNLRSRQTHSDDNATPKPPPDASKMSRSDGEEKINAYVNRSKDRPLSGMVALTMRDIDESILSATLERMPKDTELNTQNLVEMLAQEALWRDKSQENYGGDSGIIEDKRSQEQENSAVIEDTPPQGLGNIGEAPRSMPAIPPEAIRQKTGNSSTAVNKASTSDESNTSAINETPATYVNTRRRPLIRLRSARKPDLDKNNETIDEEDAIEAQVVDDFFYQHLSGRRRQRAASSLRAKRINETTSDSTSSDFDACLVSNKNFNVNVDQFNLDLEVMECLTSMVDKVCSDLEKCSQQLILDMAKTVDPGAPEEIEPLEDIPNAKTNKASGRGKGRKPAPKKKALKTTLKSRKEKDEKTKKEPKKATKNKLEIEPATKSSATEVVSENVSPVREKSDSLVRRKRKLYSPKDNENVDDTKENKDSEDDLPLKVIQEKAGPLRKVLARKSNAACYIDIEQDRRIFRSRQNRRSKCVPPVSPKSKKLNDDFDRIKETIEGTEKVILVDKKSDKDTAVFNFSSDSEDEAFKKKHFERKQSADSVHSLVSTRSGRVVNKVNYDDYEERAPLVESNERTTKKKVPLRLKKGRKAKVERGLEDEKMRIAPTEDLNTSFVTDKPRNAKKALEPKILAPQPEVIDEDQALPDPPLKTESKKPAKKKDVITKLDLCKTSKPESKRAKTRTPEGRRSKTLDLDVSKDDSNEKTSSPLPGLVVETVNPVIADADDSIMTANLFQKITKLCENPEACDDMNTTQNLLSDNERVGSPSDIAEEVHRVFGGMSPAADFTKTDENGKNKRGSGMSNKEKVANTGTETKMVDENTRSCLEGVTKQIKLKLKKKAAIETNEDSSPTKSNNPMIPFVVLEKHGIDETIKPQSSKAVEQVFSEAGLSNEVIVIDDTDTLNPQSVIKTSPSGIKSNTNAVVSLDLTSDFEGAEKSISSVGITGHGSPDESPPRNLKEKFVSRELEDLDSDLREYKNSLRKVTENCYEFLGKENNTKTPKQTAEKDPVVVLERMPEGSDHSCASSNSQIKWGDDAIYLPSRKTSSASEASSIKSLTPKEHSIKFDDVDDLFTKISSVKHDAKTKEQPKGECTPKHTPRKSLISPLNLQDINKIFTYSSLQINKTSSQNNTSASPQKPDSSDSIDLTSDDELEMSRPTIGATKAKMTNRPVAKPQRSGPISSVTKKVDSVKCSIKLPLKSTGPRDKLVSIPEANVRNIKEPKDKQPLVLRLQAVGVNSAGNKVFKKPDIREAVNKTVVSSQDTNNRSSQTPKGPKGIAATELSPDSREIIRRFLINMEKSAISTPRSTENFAGKWGNSTPHSKLATPTAKQSPNPLKKPSNDPQVKDNPKRRRLDFESPDEVVTLPSCPSTASVVDWLKSSRTCVSDKKAIEIDQIGNILEKIDTTLQEIHQNSFRDFISYFVDVQKELKDMESQRQARYSAMWQEIMRKMSELMEKIKVEFGKTDSEMFSTFVAWHKQKVMALLREECQKKTAMVQLLREDVRAVADHLGGIDRKQDGSRSS